MDIADYKALFGVHSSHTLQASRHVRPRHVDERGQTRWLDERDAAGKLVARYRTWTRELSLNPVRQQFGWERWSLDGHLLDREVRYSTKSSKAGLH